MEAANVKLRADLKENRFAFLVLTGDKATYHNLVLKNKELEETLEQERRDLDVAIKTDLNLEPHSTQVIIDVAQCSVETMLMMLTKKLDALSPSTQPSSITRFRPCSLMKETAMLLQLVGHTSQAAGASSTLSLL